MTSDHSMTNSGYYENSKYSVLFNFANTIDRLGFIENKVQGALHFYFDLVKCMEEIIDDWADRV